MRKLIFLLSLLLGVTAFVACSNQETYADQKKRERSAINNYIQDSAVSVISETQFATQNYTTDVSKNEWVLFESTGVYMQIIRQGCGEKIKDGETVTVLCRYTERNMLGDSIEMSNILSSVYSRWVDKMSVVDNSGTFTGSFISGESTLVLAHSLSSTSVPTGWLVPLTFIKVGRPVSETDEIAKVRLIVPHDVGHLSATASVIPYLYDITYERGR
ncbi:MAG: DUF4827 domain-containing protein [Prevotella sp.]|nr:DUF4827 domain-containing protein [Prevotella sp.]